MGLFSGILNGDKRMIRAEKPVTAESLLAAPPPLAPDLTDAVIREARLAERNRNKTGRTRASTFLSSADQPGAVDLSTKSLLGGV